VSPDEQAIRDLVRTWLRASASGELDQVLSLMSHNVVFLTPGQKPFGKEAFASAARASHGKVRFDAESEVEEVQVAGDLAFCRTHLRVAVTPAEGGETKRLSGHTLSVLRKGPDGRWLLVRDSNLLAPEPSLQSIRAAVPVFQVESVARSVTWYGDVLGFKADPFGPPEEPVFAILRRDGVELMVQKARREARPALSGLGMNAYLRVADVYKVRESALARIPDAPQIERREYGCQEFSLTDPDGNVLVIGQCG
jgi:uncharacterized protein (TIGR02246 family)